MKAKKDGRWVWLPLVLGVTAFKNAVLVPRLDWGIDAWARVEIPLTIAAVAALVQFVRWVRRNRRP